MIGIKEFLSFISGACALCLGASLGGHYAGWIGGIVGGIGGGILGVFLGLFYSIVILGGLDDVSIKLGKRNRWIGAAVTGLWMISYSALIAAIMFAMWWSVSLSR